MTIEEQNYLNAGMIQLSEYSAAYKVCGQIQSRLLKERDEKIAEDTDNHHKIKHGVFTISHKPVSMWCITKELKSGEVIECGTYSNHYSAYWALAMLYIQHDLQKIVEDAVR